MATGEPSDISEARVLFQKFERTADHSERVRHFEDALDLLDSYLPDQDTSQAGQLAENLRRTYTRRLLEQLSSLHSLDITGDKRVYFEDWLRYSVLLTKLQKEVDALCTENQASQQNFDEFLGIWKDEFISAAEKYLAKT